MVYIHGLARGWQDAQCAPGEQQEDGCRGSPPEGQGDEGGGAGDTGPLIRIDPCQCTLRLVLSKF